MNSHKGFDSPLTSRYLTEFLSKYGHDHNSFWGVCVENTPLVEKRIGCNIFKYDFDVQEGDYLEEMARRSIGPLNTTVKLLRLNNHIIHTNHINSFFKCF